MNNKAVDVLVIGAGIIGLSVAEKLVDQGLKVTLIEKEEVAAGASRGNAAGLAFSDIMPLASPGMVKKSIKWLMDPLGPFSVVPGDLPFTMTWLLRFLRASRSSQFEKSIVGQASLMELGQTSFQTVLERTGLKSMIRDNGALHLYQSRESYRRDQANWQYRARHGLDYSCYEGQALHEFQSGLSDRFLAGVFVPAWSSVSDPADYCHALYKHLIRRGASVVYGEVKSIDPGNGSQDRTVEVILDSGQQLEARQVVIAAGPWSAELSKQLGDKVPMVGERGYNTTLPQAALLNPIERTLVFSDHGFVFTPLENGYRIGGASEIARLDRAPNYRRSKLMAEKASQFLPGLEIKEGKEWMGARPSTPDTLPVIDYSTRSRNIVYAFGHGHLGLTQSTATAQLVSELLLRETPSIDIEPLQVKRFAWR
ncbi:NAD(P)/FAD-dependent oxidoreductase [Endozoicomonas arenosclerae]|uniref:NAD(P)/FAD-dependent oxidoreductase n=1 Tax=Endozoicomonas arenosclerae TaxID=1633495 RepID=UPI00155FE9F8|nr:FAD-binding oxidoreductase [Endozoicomonas arenosclerae]